MPAKLTPAEIVILLQRKFTLSDHEISQIDSYHSVIVEYWQLVDMLVTCSGMLRSRGEGYVAILRGKISGQDSQNLADSEDGSTMVKTGQFRLSFRSWKHHRYVLVKEILV